MILIKVTMTMTVLSFILNTQKSFRQPAGTQFVKKNLPALLYIPKALPCYVIFSIFPVHRANY